MSRATLILAGQRERAQATAWIAKAPVNTRVEFKQPKRSTDQNSLMWSLLTQVATQKEHCGRRYTPDQWKILMLHAFGREVQFVPSLDGSTFIPWGQSSSDLSKQEMTELIEFIISWGAQNGVRYREFSEAA